MAYEFKNSKGVNYYLHKKTVKLRGSGKMQIIYYFSKDTGGETLDEVPQGFRVMEIKRTGLPVLKKK